VDELPILRLPESVVVFGIGVALREAYNTGLLLLWYRSIGMHFTLLHVKFEDVLSMPVLKNRATRHKNLQLEIVKFLKKSNVLKPDARFIHTLSFSTSRVRKSRLGAPVRASTEAYSKE
jgi:hypothetical protein